jgi:hypothetical protein
MSFGDGNLFGLFGWGKGKANKPSFQVGRGQSVAANPANSQRIISFRIDGESDHKLSRELSIRSETRSDFIRNAIERALQLDAQERLRRAHSAILWD